MSANVWAGATPTAHVYPYHSDPEKVTIKVDDYAYWQGKATGTLNRSYLLPSNGEVVPEDPEIETKTLYLLIRRKRSNTRSVIGWGIMGVGIGGCAFGPVGAAIGGGLGAAIGATMFEEWNEIDTVNFGQLVMELDPVDGYLMDGEDFVAYQVTYSSAYVTGHWTDWDRHAIQGSGGEVLYHVSHAHELADGTYGPLHHE